MKQGEEIKVTKGGEERKQKRGERAATNGERRRAEG